MIATAFTVDCSGSPLLSSHRLPLPFNGPIRTHIGFPKVLRMPILHCPPIQRQVIKCAVSGRNHYMHSRQEFNTEPFWVSLIKDVVWSLRSLVVFLIEQPSQLKYIEWPSFQNTLKTASLTLVLVAALIVALSSIDAALSFTLSLLLRRAA